MLSKGKGKSKDGEKREGQSFSVIATQRERVEVGPGRRSLSSSRRAASVGDPFAKGLTGPSWLVHSLSLLSSSLPSLPLLPNVYLPSTMNNDSKEHGHDIAILSS